MLLLALTSARVYYKFIVIYFYVHERATDAGRILAKEMMPCTSANF
jgi:hypothetical protein